MDLISRLNPRQRTAVEHGKGPALVLAGAGSGKTRVITYRIAWLIRNGACRPENILAVTFTNKAAREMRERVHALLESMRTSEPLISTFHSLCVRLLRREIHLLGYRRDFSIYDTDDQRRLMKQILGERKIEETVYSPRELLSRISYAKNHGVPPGAYTDAFPSPFADDVADFYEAYNRRLRQAQALDFDDLLLRTVELFERFPDRCAWHSDWFRYILVDEYQDTNRPQYELLCLLSSRHGNLFVVGDEDQSIYKFRGADIGNILRFEKDFPGTRLIKLEQNYRSTQNILRIAGGVVERNVARKGKTLWTENTGGDVATCYRARTARDEAEWVADRIDEILREMPECRVAVLYRTNFMSRNFEDVLTDRRIPFAVVGSVGFFSRMEVKDMLAYLRVIHNPEDDVALLRIINTPPRGIGSTTLDLLTQTALEKGVPISAALKECAGDPKAAGRTHKALASFQEMLDGWSEYRETATVDKLIARVLAETDYRAMLERQETAQEARTRVENIEELIRAANESQERNETVFEFLDRAALSSELDHLDPDARVCLMTLHSAKGLEFDTVFLAGLEEGLLPHAQSQGKNEDLEEERRLCYVGITRARRKLFLSWTPFRRTFGAESGSPSAPSRFLGEMPRELIESLDLSVPRIHRGEDWGYTRERPQAYAPQPVRRPSLDAKPKTQPRTIAELQAYLEEVKRGQAGSTGAAGGPILKSGMRVRHAQFGDGIILSRERMGNDIRLTVTFSRVGKKTLVERYAKLEPI